MTLAYLTHWPFTHHFTLYPPQAGIRTTKGSMYDFSFDLVWSFFTESKMVRCPGLSMPKLRAWRLSRYPPVIAACPVTGFRKLSRFLLCIKGFSSSRFCFFFVLFFTECDFKNCRIIKSNFNSFKDAFCSFGSFASSDCFGAQHFDGWLICLKDIS